MVTATSCTDRVADTDTARKLDFEQMSDNDVLLKLLEELSARIRASSQRAGSSGSYISNGCATSKEGGLGRTQENAVKECLTPPQEPSTKVIQNSRPDEASSVHTDGPTISSTLDGGMPTSTGDLDVLYACLPPKGIDSLPRHTYEGLRIARDDPVDPASEARVNELLRLMDNVLTVPEDGRLSLSPISKDLLYLEWTHEFYKELRTRRGDFWIRDFDSHKNIKHYHYRHAMCRNRAAFGGEYTSEDDNPYNTIGDVYAHDKSEQAFTIPSISRTVIRHNRDVEIKPRTEAPRPKASWKRVM